MQAIRILAAIGLVALLISAALLVAALYPSVLRAPFVLLTNRDVAGRADLIVVLSPNTVERVLAARDLYTRGFSSKILLIPEPPVAEHLRVEMERLGFGGRSPYTLSQRILTASGVPLSAMDALPAHARNTRDEARLVGVYAADRGVKSILLVTSQVSSRRACWIFRRGLRGVRINCQPSGYEDVRYDRKAILVLINELVKFGANGVGIN